VRGLRDVEERSQDAPQVVTQVPAKVSKAQPHNPALARLPKP
jgi:hypothetical protein